MSKYAIARLADVQQEREARLVARAAGLVIQEMSAHRCPRAELPLSEGLAAIELPSNLSKESVETVRAWLDVLMKSATAK